MPIHQPLFAKERGGGRQNITLRDVVLRREVPRLVDQHPRYVTACRRQPGGDEIHRLDRLTRQDVFEVTARPSWPSVSAKQTSADAKNSGAIGTGEGCRQ